MIVPCSASSCLNMSLNYHQYYDKLCPLPSRPTAITGTYSLVMLQLETPSNTTPLLSHMFKMTHFAIIPSSAISTRSSLYTSYHLIGLNTQVVMLMSHKLCYYATNVIFSVGNKISSITCRFHKGVRSIIASVL